MIAGVVLAAGTSSRLGGRLKQLLPLGGRPITQHVINAAVAAGLDDVVVVLGHKAEEVRGGLELRPPARAVVNPDYASGQSSSLRTGLHALGDDIGAALILLGDQPGIRLEAIRTVMRVYERTGGPVVRASYSGQSGHPVLFERSVWAELGKLGFSGFLMRPRFEASTARVSVSCAASSAASRSPSEHRARISSPARSRSSSWGPSSLVALAKRASRLGLCGVLRAPTFSGRVGLHLC